MSDNKRGWTKGPDANELYVEAMESNEQSSLAYGIIDPRWVDVSAFTPNASNSATGDRGASPAKADGKA